MNAVDFQLQTPLASLQSNGRERAFGLRELRYFLSVARTGNFGRAARELNISQPAVSHQIRRLEEDFGTQLLLRQGRAVTLTPAGVCLRDRLDTVMQLLSSPLDDERAAATMPGTVSLAVPAEAGPLLVAPLAKQFRARWPHVTLDIREGNGVDLEEWVLHGRVDIAILQDPPSLAELEVIPILTESLGLVAPVRSELASDKRPLRLRDLAGESLILPNRQHWIRRRVERAAHQYGIRLTPVLQVNSVPLTKEMVRNGLGCTILPCTSVREDVARGALAFRPIGHPPLSSTRVIAFRGGASGAVIAEFAGIARDAIASLVTGGAWPGVQVIKSGPRPVEPSHGCTADSDLMARELPEVAIQ
jgi:LysR family nitrogen assimilation transcriptional regulator